MTRLTMVPRLSCSFLLLVGGAAASAQTGPTSAAIDADVWIPVAASAAADDIAAMGRVYNPDAVLVTPEGTRPISQVLAGWGKDMAVNKGKGIRASVALRFSKRQDDAETAYESGMFRYTLTDRAGVSTPRYRRFEALLVKTAGKWRVLMERQLEVADEASWNAIAH